MHKRTLLFLFAVVAITATAAQRATHAQTSIDDPDFRIWRARSGGYSTKATLLKFEEGVVHLKKQDGTLVSLPLDKLTDADQQYVKRWAGNNKPAEDVRHQTTPADKAASSELEVGCRQLCVQITKGYRGKDAGGKPTIAVVEFSDLSGGVTDFGRLLSEELITGLFATGHYKVVERLLLNKAIADHNLQLQGLVDPKSAKELGKILGVDAIVSGTVADLGDSLRVNARLISTETGEVFSVAATTIGKDDSVQRLLGATGGNFGARSNRGGQGIGAKGDPKTNETLEDKLRRHKRTINTSAAVYDAVEDEEVWIIEVGDVCTADQFDAEQTRLLRSWVSNGGVLWVNSNVLSLFGVRYIVDEYWDRANCIVASGTHPIVEGVKKVRLYDLRGKAFNLSYRGVVPLLAASENQNMWQPSTGTSAWSLVPYGKGWIGDPKPLSINDDEGALFWGQFCQFCLREIPWPKPRTEGVKPVAELPGKGPGAGASQKSSKISGAKK